MNKLAALLILTTGFVGACNDEKPDNAIQAEGSVIIAIDAFAGDEPLAPAGITAAAAIELEGQIVDEFGVAESFYSWNGSEPAPLTLGIEGGFSLALDLVSGKNELVISARSVVETELVDKTFTYTLDNTPPQIVLPVDRFAGTIIPEGEMDLDKQPTSLTLSGGEPVSVKDGVNFSKFSTTWTSNNTNLPLWRFGMNDEHPLDDASMEIQVYHLEGGNIETLIVDWTDVPKSEEEFIFEILLGSELSENLSKLSGDFAIDVRGKDSAGNSSESARVSWRQTIINPPIFLGAGNEDIMSPVGAGVNTDSYRLGDNFSDLTFQAGLEIGSAIVGNPNDVEVMVRLDEELFQGAASHRHERDIILIDDDYGADSSVGTCQSRWFNLSNGWCEDRKLDNNEQTVVRRIGESRSAEGLRLLIKDADGQPIDSNSNNEFTMPPHTIFHVIAVMPNAPTNLMPNIEELFFSPYLQNDSFEDIGNFAVCESFVTNRDGPTNACGSWSLYKHAERLVTQYASWDFELSVKSTIGRQDSGFVDWVSANDGNVSGFTKTISVAAPGFAAPTSHNGI